MTVDYSLEEMISLIKDGADKIMESSGDRELVNFYALHYGPIAYTLFNTMKSSILLDVKTVFSRVKNCDCDLDWPEFWNDSSMIVSLSEYLDFAKIDKDKIYASAS